MRASEASEKYYVGVAAPIVSQGDIMGCVLLLSDDKSQAVSEADQKVAQTMAGFLGTQIES